MTLLLGSSLLALAPQAARAEPTAAAKETARAWVVRGNERFAAEDLEGALEAFRKADELVHAPTTALGVGRALMKLGRLVEARDVFLGVTRIPESPGESTAFRDARDEASQSAEALLQRIATVTLRVSCAGAEAPVRVTVDGEPAAMNGETGLLRIDPGQHTMVGAAPGCREAARQIALAEGERMTVELELESIPRAPTVLPLLISGSVVAGLGLAVGIGTGVASLDAASGLSERCPAGVCPTAESELGARAVALAHASTTSFVLAGVGAVGLVAGLVLWSDGAAGGEPRPERKTTRLAPAVRLVVGPGSCALAGAFE